MKTFDEAYEIFFKMYGTGSGMILGQEKDHMKKILKRFINVMEVENDK